MPLLKLIDLNDSFSALQYYRAANLSLREELGKDERVFTRLEKKLIEALKEYARYLQAFEAELTAKKILLDQLNADKRHVYSEGLGHFNVLSLDEETREYSRWLFYDLAKTLFAAGACIDPIVFDDASLAYRTNDFSKLYSLWAKARERFEKLASSDTPEEPKGFIKLKELVDIEVRQCLFLTLSIQHIREKIILVQNNSILKTYLQGRRAFTRYLKEKKQHIQREIKGIDREIALYNRKGEKP